jgi:hypothetical protein
VWWALGLRRAHGVWSASARRRRPALVDVTRLSTQSWLEPSATATPGDGITIRTGKIPTALAAAPPPGTPSVTFS